LVQTHGYIQITNNKIIVHFPIKPDHTVTFKSMHQIQFVFNNQVIFHSEWLPILTHQDRTKFKSMFCQIWYEYSKLTHYKYPPLPSYGPSVHDEIITNYDKPSYYLACSETYNTTSIELTTRSSTKSTSHTTPVHIQFYFDHHLILCSQVQLRHLEPDDLHFVLSFILQKLMN